LLQLKNPKAPPDLAGELALEFLSVQDDYDPTQRPKPCLDAREKHVEMRVGQWTFLRISNYSSHDLNIVVLDLQPDWGITQIYPSEGGANLFTLDCGDSFDLPFNAQLPDGIEEGTVVLKVFATFAAADFHCLELPPLDQPRTRGMRIVLPPPPASAEWYGTTHEEWVTAQVEVKMRRRPN
jgi:hypothetical protein